MKAMILAAGRGERMRPLSDTCPKPLLSLGAESLITRHLRRLTAAGFREIVINLAWLGEKIVSALGDGSAFGVSILYSYEEAGGLETAGGIATALPLLGDQPFLTVNGDIFSNMDFQAAFKIADTLDLQTHSAHLWLVANPSHHPQGDFGIDVAGRLVTESILRYTFSGVAVYHPRFFAAIEPHKKIPLAPLLRKAATKKRVSASFSEAAWLDVGTPERLEEARRLAALMP